MDISGNVPCPCGSGKKYKRCCMGKGQSDPGAPRGRASEERENRLVEEMQLRLVETMELPKKLGWTEFDFQVDLFDPVLDDVQRAVARSAGVPSDDEIMPCVIQGLIRHGTLEVRARCSEELERRLEKVGSRKVSEECVLVLRALEDEDWPAPGIGLLLALYRRYILLRSIARMEFIDAEEKALDAGLIEQATAAATSGAPEDYQALARRIAPLGAGALPYVEHAVCSDSLDESIGPLVEIAGNHPSMRSARILCIMRDLSDTQALNQLLFDAMARMPDHAWPVLLHQVRDRDRPCWERHGAAEFLVRARVSEVYEPLVEDLWREHEEGEDWDDEAYKDVARMLAELGDRRAVGNAIFHAHDGAIPKVVLDALESEWRENGWWDEVQEGLGTLRRGGRLLVRAGEEFKDFVRQDLAAAPVDALASANFRLGLTEEDWNHAYHEELDWLRPCDLEGFGPREAALMRDFVGFAQAHVARLEREPRGSEVGRMFADLQDEWMTTPQAALGGRAPLAVILNEKKRLDKHPAHFRKYLRGRLSALCAEARVAIEEGDRATALRYLRVVLDVEPEHPVARRLMAKAR